MYQRPEFSRVADKVLHLQEEGRDVGQRRPLHYVRHRPAVEGVHRARRLHFLHLSQQALCHALCVSKNGEHLSVVQARKLRLIVSQFTFNLSTFVLVSILASPACRSLI